MFFVFAISAPLSAYAESEAVSYEESEELSSVRYSTVDDVMDNFNNKMILSLFGTSGLKGFLGDSASDSAIRDISSLTAKEIESYSEPFPSGVGDVIKTITYSLYVLVSLYFGSLMFRYVLERIFMSQDDKATNSAVGAPFYMVMVRAFVGFFVAVPIAGALTAKFAGKEDQAIYSAMHMFMFSSFGLAFRAADDISMHFNDTKSVYSPIYTVPESDIYAPEFRNLIDFGMCIQTSEVSNRQVKSHNFEVSYKNKKVYIRGLVQNCSLNMNFEIDSQLDSNIKSLHISELNGVEMSLSQIESFKRHLASLVNDALTYSHAVANNLKSQKGLKNGTSVQVDLANWQSTCQLKPSTRGSGLNSWYQFSVDREKFSRCLSRKHVMYLSYPNTDLDFDTVVESGESRLNGRLKETCAPINGSFKDVINNTGKEYLRSCVVKACKGVNLNSPKSGLFECSVAVTAYKKMEEAEDFNKRGFLVNSVRHFTDINQEQISNSSKTPLNSLSSYFELSTEIDNSKSENLGTVSSLPNPSSGSNGIKISVQHVGASMSNLGLERFKNAWSSTRIYSSSDAVPVNNGLKLILINEPLSRATESVNPFSRAMNCMKKANQLTQYGLCGSVVSEITRLGVFSTGLLISIYLGNTAGKLLDTASSKAGEAALRRGGGDAAVSRDATSPRATPAKALKAVEWFTSSAKFVGASSLMGAGLFGIHTNSEDHYGYIESDAVGYLFSVAGIAMYMANKTQIPEEHSLAGLILGTLKGILFYTILVSFVVIPLLPLYFLYVGIVTAIAAMISLFIAGQFILISILANADEIDPTTRVKKAVSRFIVAFIRFPLVVMGFYVAIHMIDVIVPSVALMIDETLAISYSTNAGLAGSGLKYVVNIFSFIITLLFVMLVVYSCIDVVKQLYSVSRSLLMGQDTESDSGTTVETTKAIQDKAKTTLAGR